MESRRLSQKQLGYWKRAKMFKDKSSNSRSEALISPTLGLNTWELSTIFDSSRKTQICRIPWHTDFKLRACVTVFQDSGAGALSAVEGKMASQNHNHSHNHHPLNQRNLLIPELDMVLFHHPTTRLPQVLQNPLGHLLHTPGT